MTAQVAIFRARTATWAVKAVSSGAARAQVT
jgi:hypothetical protein